MKSSSNVIRGATSAVKLAAWQPVSLDSNQDGGSPTLPQAGIHTTPLSVKQALSPEQTDQVSRPGLGQAAVSSRQAQVALSGMHRLRGPELTRQVMDWMPQEFVIQPTGKVRTAEDNTAAMMELRQMQDELLRTTMEQAQYAAQQQFEKMIGEAQRNAEQILDEANRQAQQIILQANAGASQVTQQAYQDGTQASHAEAAGMLQLVQSLADEVRQWKENILAQSEPMVVGLVQDIARKLFGEGFVLDAESLGKAFERSLEEAKNLGNVRIRAHPEDVALLGALWPVHQTAVTGQQIELIPNQDIERGGCFIEGEFGSVDARVKTQLRLITETLGDVMASEAQGSDPFTPYEKDGGD
jgi:flagellar assembly protein FliH